MPVLIGRPATPVAVLTGVSVPEIVFTTYAVPSDGEMATAAGEYPTGMPRPARPVAAVMAVTVSEAPRSRPPLGGRDGGHGIGVAADDEDLRAAGCDGERVGCLAGRDGRAGAAGGGADRGDGVGAVVGDVGGLAVRRDRDRERVAPDPDRRACPVG